MSLRANAKCCALDLNVVQAAGDDVTVASVNVTAKVDETAAATEEPAVEPAVEVVKVGPATRGSIPLASSTFPQHANPNPCLLSPRARGACKCELM